jgi:hypothetical protein
VGSSGLLESGWHSESGAAYLFELEAGQWKQSAYFKDTPALDALFGIT